jgi:two-component system response regulator HydG
MKTILLIDAEAESSGLVAILNRLGYKVIAVQDGPSALSITREGAPIDLVIMECRLAGMDGLELLASLKKLAPTLPSIILTAYGSIETYLKAYSLGVFEYLNKPVKKEELVRIVKAALEKTRALKYYEKEERLWNG